VGELQISVFELQKRVGELLGLVGELQKMAVWVGELQKTDRLSPFFTL
jgi:hypothetical protein